jgi:hypothetical protein
MAALKQARFFFLTAAAFGGIVACSGAVIIGQENPNGVTDSGNSSAPDVGLDAGRDGPSTKDAPSDGVAPMPDASSPHCPTAAPKAGSTCPKVGLECEYGTNAGIACNTVATCSTSGWTYASSLPDTPCVDGSCPTDYPGAEPSDTCAPKGLVCTYGQGTCTCGAPPGPATVDASVTWDCYHPKGCPVTRPSLGSPCTTPASTTCDYGACAGGVTVYCDHGTWHEVMTGCPAS